MPRPAIHQFHAGSAFGDGVTNAMLLTQRLLQHLGFESEIFAAQVDPVLGDRIKPMSAYPDRASDVLLLHHSMGHAHDTWVTRLKSRRVLVYHNITPPELLPESGDIRRYARHGRQQLRDWRHLFEAALAVSPYNARELSELGYPDVRVLPLLVDLEGLRETAPDPDALRHRRETGAFNVLFVGRLVPHKRQDRLIRAVARLRGMLDRPVRLVLPGHPGDDGYVADLQNLAAEQAVKEIVEIPGPISHARLAAEYRACDAFCGLSQHEGFGMPLIEAMAADMPVIADAHGAVPDTVGEGGVLLDTGLPDDAAAALKLVAEEPGLRRRVIEGQRRNLARFERRTLLNGLAGLLDDLDIPHTHVEQVTPPRPAPLDTRVEGPFDSTYSLAIVNLELARALDRQGLTVGLHSTEGGGDYAPDAEFLRRTPDAARLHKAARNAPGANVVLRNCFPPRTDGMPAPTRVVANYAWEESGFPRDRVAAFNRDLNLITVTSRYVAKVLRDNGVRTPLAVVGNGVDHITRTTPRPPTDALPQAGFTFLHVSSCFPRKGADALLAAWARAFSRDDDVALVIKTFPNPHNDIEAQVRRLGVQYPNHAPITVINRDTPAAELAGLYRTADAFVGPSRGEGFGLPMAEAALFDLPVVTTGHSGHSDFCTPETAWLVDYRFARAETHLGLPHSVWADPDTTDLAQRMRDVRTAGQPERRRRCEALKALVTQRFTWDAVASRTRAALAALDRRPAVDLPPKTAWVTSWNTRCGIAAYARFLSCRMAPGRMTVLANRSDDRILADADNVVRCWNQGWSDDLAGLASEIEASGAEAVVFQFNFGFFHIAAFGRLLQDLHVRGVATYVFMHATADVDKPDVKISLREIPEALSGVQRIFVHGIDDLNRLKAFGHVDNVTLFPHGVGRVPDVDAGEVRARHGLGDGPTLASFGFLLPHKGLADLVAAFEQLRDARPDLQLVMLNALYPAPESAEARDALQARIDRSRHRDGITLVTDYLSDEAALSLLSIASAVVYPYQHTQESASGAVRFGMASGRPVATTPLSIFDDVADASYRLPGTGPDAIAEGLAHLLDEDDLRARLDTAQRAWLAARRWETLSDRLWNILLAEHRGWRETWLDLAADTSSPAEAAAQ